MSLPIHIDRGQLLRAVEILHWLLPLFTIFYYILSLAVGVAFFSFGRIRVGRQMAKPKALMTVKTLCIVSIFITYVSFNTTLYICSDCYDPFNLLFAGHRFSLLDIFVVRCRCGYSPGHHCENPMQIVGLCEQFC